MSADLSLIMCISTTTLISKLTYSNSPHTPTVSHYFVAIWPWKYS